MTRPTCSPRRIEGRAHNHRLLSRAQVAPHRTPPAEESTRSMNYDANQALRLLRAGAGKPDAAFRDGQEEAIRHVVEGRGRLLVVQKTGWGKSFVYFIATWLLRNAGEGPALLVSPLLSLMRNQLAAAERMGLRAATIHSDNQADWDRVETQLAANAVDVLLISPERLANERFVSNVLAPVAARVSLLVVDEAHCISDWGHDFRPHYRRLERIIRTLPANMRVLATTATANNRVMADLHAVLGPELTVSRGDLHRQSVTLQTIQLPDQAQRLAWLAQYLPLMTGSGIVYTLTVRDAEQVSAWLLSRGISAPAYTGQSDGREELEEALLENRVKALVATNALGMGFDKPDLAFVIHYQTPGSVVAYYQQVGRAGRALDDAYGVLLSGREETDIGDFFIDSAFPTPDEVQQILAALQASAVGLTVPELTTNINVSKGRIEKALALLSLESPAPLVKQGSKWQLTTATLAPTFWQRAERLTSLRKAEQAQMQAYVQLMSGHMQFLIQALDGDPNLITLPRLGPLPEVVNEGLLHEAIAFLRRTSLPIEPRKQWPVGGLRTYAVSGNIPAAMQSQAGKALCVWGDAGWGAWVRDGKYVQSRFDDHLVNACADLVRNWAPQPAPMWITSVPSLNRPLLVPDFAARLAQVLALPFYPLLIKTEARPEQKTRVNSAQQARNVDGSLAIAPEFQGKVPPGPVLLVDDMVDSRWTLTIAAWLLLSNGSGPVWPLALAQAGGGHD
jgi:ATP-dependent DNA helicase RecQ